VRRGSTPFVPSRAEKYQGYDARSFGDRSHRSKLSKAAKPQHLPSAGSRPPRYSTVKA
jgi:hypothetical protein